MAWQPKGLNASYLFAVSRRDEAAVGMTPPWAPRTEEAMEKAKELEQFR